MCNCRTRRCCMSSKALNLNETWSNNSWKVLSFRDFRCEKQTDVMTYRYVGVEFPLLQIKEQMSRLELNPIAVSAFLEETDTRINSVLGELRSLSLQKESKWFNSKKGIQVFIFLNIIQLRDKTNSDSLVKGRKGTKSLLVHWPVKGADRLLSNTRLLEQLYRAWDSDFVFPVFIFTGSVRRIIVLVQR